MKNNWIPKNLHNLLFLQVVASCLNNQFKSFFPSPRINIHIQKMMSIIQINRKRNLKQKKKLNTKGTTRDRSERESAQNHADIKTMNTLGYVFFYTQLRASWPQKQWICVLISIFYTCYSWVRWLMPRVLRCAAVHSLPLYILATHCTQETIEREQSMLIGYTWNFYLLPARDIIRTC